jgi:ribosomal protein L29
MTTEKNVAEISSEIEEKKEKLYELRIQMYCNEMKDISQIKKTRKEIARLLTVQNSGKGND